MKTWAELEVSFTLPDCLNGVENVLNYRIIVAPSYCTIDCFYCYQQLHDDKKDMLLRVS
jgi:sulfatase maturation enzyme AslB (radical SAM superfamily)